MQKSKPHASRQKRSKALMKSVVMTGSDPVSHHTLDKEMMEMKPESLASKIDARLLQRRKREFSYTQLPADIDFDQSWTDFRKKMRLKGLPF